VKEARKPAATEESRKPVAAEEAPKPVASADRYPARPAKVSGRVSCNTNCMNADCYRTYDDGRKVRFRAKQKWNPFDSRFEFDSGSC
jgi:hypothetical protein